MTTGKTIALTRWTFVGKVMSLILNMLPRLVIAFLPRSKHLLISRLQCHAVRQKKSYSVQSELTFIKQKPSLLFISTSFVFVRKVIDFLQEPWLERVLGDAKETRDKCPVFFATRGHQSVKSILAAATCHETKKAPGSCFWHSFFVP